MEWALKSRLRVFEKLNEKLDVYSHKSIDVKKKMICWTEKMNKQLEKLKWVRKWRQKQNSDEKP